MELKRLRYFVTVADEGSITAAARRLYMSQPPLSAQIKLLEQEVGAPLFTRGPRRVQLTDAGRVLYERARSMLELERLAVSDVQSLSTGMHSVRMGVVSSVGGSLLAEWVAQVRQILPDISYELTEANTYQLLESVRRGLVEFAVVRTPFSADDLTSVKLMGEGMVAVGVQQPSITLRELAERPLIIYRRWAEVLERHFAQSEVLPRYVCLCDDARTALQWARQGIGVAIVPRSAVGSDIMCSNIEELAFESDICIIHNPAAIISDAAKAVMNEIIALANNKDM
jgi:DNA-binding transcriptional LysR family regulator